MCLGLTAGFAGGYCLGDRSIHYFDRSLLLSASQLTYLASPLVQAPLTLVTSYRRYFFAFLVGIMAVVIPPGGTLLDTFRKSFVDVPVDAEKDNAISTTEFLEAAESLTTMFGTNSSFAIWSTFTVLIVVYNRCPRLCRVLPRQE